MIIWFNYTYWFHTDPEEVPAVTVSTAPMDRVQYDVNDPAVQTDCAKLQCLRMLRTAGILKCHNREKQIPTTRTPSDLLRRGLERRLDAGKLMRISSPMKNLELIYCRIDR